MIVEPKLMDVREENFSFDHQRNVNGWERLERWRIEVKNRRSVPARVEIKRRLRHANWRMEGAGTPESGAEMLALEPNRIQVSLPPSFFDGTVTAVLYVELPGEGGFTSNAVSTTLVGSGVAP